MRVIAGSRRSLPLKSLEGDNTRPTVDKYKETLFNCIQMEVPDSMFLDLFSGSGAIGIEALSRGAKKAVLVENNKQALDVIKANVHFTKFENEAEIVKSDVISYVSRLPKIAFDVIFMDPPYSKGLERRVLEVLSTKKFTTDTLIVVEAALDEDFSYVDALGFEITKDKHYKTNKHVFLMQKENV